MRDTSSESLVKNVVDELTRLRKEQGLSHEKLAEKTGLSRAAISYIENHHRVPTLLSCARIAKALDARLSDVLAKFEG